MRLSLTGTPPRSRPGELRFTACFGDASQSCAQLESIAQPEQDLGLAACQLVSTSDWPEFIDLSFAGIPERGRVFGRVSLSDIPHAAFCSDVIGSGDRAVEAGVQLLRTRPGPSLSQANVHFSATVLRDGQVVVAGGGRAIADVFSPATETFRPIDLVVPRRWHAAALLNDGRVLIAGGAAPGSPYGSMPRVEALDIVSGKSSLLPSMEIPRAGLSATVLADGRVFAAGGTDAEIYEPDAGVWLPGGRLLTARSFHTANLLPDGTVLLAGGWAADGHALATTELFNPLTGTHAAGPPMQQGRARQVAITLLDASVLIAGGGGTSAERYVPDLHAFVPAGALSVAEDDGCGTRLPSGQVVVVGENQLVHLYEPAQNRWYERAVLSQARRGCVTWPTPDGGVLVVGGYDRDYLSSSEVVEP